MHITELLPTHLRIIEFGPTNGKLGSDLVAAGYRQYLAVGLSDAAVRQNNADVLILNGSSALHLLQFRNVRHARYVALRLASAPLGWIGVLLAFIHCVLRRLTMPSIVRTATSSPEGMEGLFVFAVRHPRPHSSARRFMPHKLGVESFLHQLEVRGVRHAVLRWFDTLPHVQPGEDLDLLIDDADLECVRAILDDGPGTQPIDLYSVSGLPGADYRSMPYYPPYLAAELLDRAVVQNDLCRVPAPREHFLSLAYHALYHKGLASGIPPRGQRQSGATKADHDYPAVLRQLAQQLDIQVAITLEDLDEYLDREGWRPPHDMLVRLARRNGWLRSRLKQWHARSDTDDRIAVFLIRAQALERGGIKRAQQLITKHGFQILATRTFDDRAVAMIARSVRGGNWGRGPWPISGGPPVASIVTFDPAPLAVTRKQRRRFPFLANARLLCKEQIRDAFNEGLPADRHCNVVHSSDNGREAMDYLRIIAPDEIGRILLAVKSRSEQPHRRAA